MAGKHQGLLNRGGRYFSRLVIPKDLRPFLENKTELREALGPDRRAAIAAHHGAMARLQAQIAIAERRAQVAKGEPVTVGRYPMTVDQIALRNYNERLAFDTELRNTTHVYADREPDDSLVPVLRDGIAGKLSDESLISLVGQRIERYRRLGNTDVEFGTVEWRTLARAMCVSELDFLARVMERHDGDFTGKPEHPMLAKAVEVDEAAGIDEREFNKTTFNDMITEQQRLTGMGLGGHDKSPATLKKYRAAVHDFEHFRRDKRAATVTLNDLERWRDAMLNGGKFSRKTVLDKLAAIRAILTWGQKQSKKQLFPNGLPTEHLELPTPQQTDSSDKTYTLAQAREVLIAVRAETRPTMRWIPWLMAYSGMRVNEATQLEKNDFFQVEGRWFFHIRVGEGRTTKTHKGRKVPVHPALVDEGLIEFVQAAPSGKLFPGRFQDQRLRDWLHAGPLKAYEDRPAPNHGFRHLFEDALQGDVGHRAGLYITGRSMGSSADDYGGSDLKLLELAKQMDKVRPLF